MEVQLKTDNATPPFPALTASQRWHLELYGYVVIENVLSEEEVGRLLDASYKLKREFEVLPDPWNTPIRNCRLSKNRALGKGTDFNMFFHVLEADPLFLEYATHPRILGMADEVVGNTVRVSESQVMINSRTHDDTFDGPGRYLWHRSRPEVHNYTFNGLYHCNFVKAITNLTDLDENDGGTCVIAGCHKSTCKEEGIVKAARENPSLIHQVVAPAGSTLLFCETLLHSTGDIRSDRERVIIIAGYQPWNYRTAMGFDFTPEFEHLVPESLKKRIFGSDLNARLRRRTLEMAVGSADPGDYLDGWSLKSADHDSLDVHDNIWQNGAEFIGSP